ncbi:UxaA family hydrolase, partial [Stenotrophomonas maltophilia]|uniref:UxaA family hydrolase n=1 Tax=Stenotrophomonas maltophilia TaxID=40324 RepID=UPI0013DCB986
IDAGKRVDGVTATARVLKGHKMATQPIAQDAPVVKYGQIIGFASQPIAPGEWVHSHNCHFATFDRDYAFAK